MDNNQRDNDHPTGQRPIEDIVYLIEAARVTLPMAWSIWPWRNRGLRLQWRTWERAWRAIMTDPINPDTVRAAWEAYLACLPRDEAGLQAARDRFDVELSP